MKRLNKAKITAAVLAICMIFSLSNAVLIASAATAIDTIVGYAGNDDASALDIATLKAAGVTETSLIAGNLSRYQEKIADATENQVDTIAEIQALIDGVNTEVAIEVIEAYAGAPNADALTISQLAAAGVTTAVEVNLAAYKTAIIAKAKTDVDSTAEIQALITKVNGDHSAAAITTIKGYATANDASALTIEKLAEAGVTGAVLANLDRYKAKIKAASSADVDTISKIQTLVNTANSEADAAAATEKENARIAAVATIRGYAANDDASDLKDNLAILVTAGVAADKVIDANKGVHDVDISKSTGYIGAIERAASYQVDTTDEIIAIIEAVNTQYATSAGDIAAAVNTIAGYAANDNASALTSELLAKAGITGTISVNFGTHGSPSTGYMKAIEDATRSEADTTAEIQGIIDDVNDAAHDAAIIAIKGYADGHNANALTIATLLAARVTSSTAISDNLAGYKAKIASITGVEVDTTEKIQGIVDGVNADVAKAKKDKEDAIAAIKKAAGDDDASAITDGTLATAGVTNIVLENMSAYKTAIAAATSDAADTTAEIQTIINTVNANEKLSKAITLISGYGTAEGKAGNADAMTPQQLKDAGVTGVVDSYLNYYKIAVANTAANKLTKTADIQAVITAINNREAAVKIISEYAGNDDASQLTLNLLSDAGVTSALEVNLSQYKVKIAAATLTGASTTAGIQSIIDGVNQDAIDAVITTISLYAGNKDASALTIDQLNFIKLSNVIGANISRYKAAIALKADKTLADSKAELQDIIDNANSAAVTAIISTISGYAGNDNADALTPEMLLSAGIANVVSQNLSRYKTKIVNATSGSADSFGEIQTLINSANDDAVIDAINVIKAYATLDDASALTIDKLAEAGVKTGANDGLAAAIEANLKDYKTRIEASTATEVETTVQIQNIITAVNTDAALGKAISVISGYADANDASALTIAQLDAVLGVGVAVGANLGLYKTAIAGKNKADVDTKAEIQAVIGTADTLAANIAKVAAYADGAGALTIADLTTIGITGAIGENLDAYKTAIEAKNVADVNTAAKIQSLINDTNTASKATAFNNIKSYAANDNAGALTIKELVIAGVSGATGDNLELYKTAIANLVPDSVDTTAEVQAIVTGINRDEALKLIKIYAGNDDPTKLTIDQLKAATITGIVDEYLTNYSIAVAKATTNEVDTAEELQALINSVNDQLNAEKAAKAVASITSVTGGTVQGTIPAGSKDKAYLPTVTINVPSETTIKVSSFTVEGLSVLSLYTNSDFTGAVGEAGIAVTGSSVLYAKVVSNDASVTVYYKLVFNIVNPDVVRYGITGSDFVKVGSNFEATVTLTRGDAAFLNDPKLLLIYTLSDGQTQVYITQNAVIGANAVVVGAGVTKVDVVLVDGKVDWTDPQSPNRKSLFISLNFPA